jgi:hypothetical protein
LRLYRQLGVHKQIFQFEQFAQGVDCLYSFVLAAHRAKPVIHVPAMAAADPSRMASPTKARASASEASRCGFGVSLTTSGGSMRKSSMNVF